MPITLSRIVTGYGLSPGHRPTVALADGLSLKLDLDLGGTTLRLGLGKDRAAAMTALAAMRDDLDALLTTKEKA